MVNATPEAAVYDKASLALRVYQRHPLVPELLRPRLCVFSSAKYARWIEYRSRDAISREEEVEQRVQQMLLALLGIARPDDQSALWRQGPLPENFRAPL